MQSRPIGPAGLHQSALQRPMAILMLALAGTLTPLLAQQDSSTVSRSAAPALFRSSVNLVSISAVVRDSRGRVVPALKKGDFEILDDGQRRPVVDLRADSNAPASVALLVDGSGSMRIGSAQAYSHRISSDLLANLNAARDSAALLSFDTRLLTLCEFTRDFEQIRDNLANVEAFGSTSLYDAVAGSAAIVAERTRNRRAVIVLTDGFDNASSFSPEKVAWIASTIDVPIYAFDVGTRPSHLGSDGIASRSPLAELARATGGDFFLANTPERVVTAVKRVSEELRHQYLIAFEAAPDSGLRRVEIRTRKSSLRVQARNWYQVEE